MSTVSPPTRDEMGFQVPQVPARPYSNGARLRYGIGWSIWTAIWVIAFVTLIAGGSAMGALWSLVFAGLSGRYAYRILTYQAKTLWFFFIF